MGVLEAFWRRRERRIRMELSRQAHPDAQRVEAAVDRILRRAGARPHTDGRGLETPAAPDPHRLFEFEREVEEISDAIRSLLVSDRTAGSSTAGSGAEAGEAAADSDRAAGLRICRKLYEFAEETMADSYMPLYLYLLYRYAQALLDAGQPEAALERFQALYDGTERLIGVNNSYGISCLERVAAAAGQAGQKTVAAAAMEAMRRTAREAFEKNSAMALAVERIVKA